MAEATIKNLSSPLPGEEPFIGDGGEGELITNTSDARAWVFDQTGFPVELGGACVNKPVNGNLFTGNYLEIDITNPDNLPIPNTDPLRVRPGVCREIRILIKYIGIPLTTFSTYFDYEVEWGGGIPDPLEEYAELGNEILIELSTFGPRPAWIGRVLWVKNRDEVIEDEFVGNLTGNASTATRLQTQRTINGVGFDGTQNITVQANTPNTVTFNNSGSGEPSGVSFNGNTPRTISYNTIGSVSSSGQGASGTWNIGISGNSATATRLLNSRQINGVPFNGTASINISAPPSHSVYKTVYVSPEGNNNSSGRNENRAVASIEKALEIIEAQSEPTGWTVKLLGGVTTSGQIPVPDFTTIMSFNMQRRTIITPTAGNEENNVFLCGNGAHLYGLKFTGWRINDFDDPTGGFAMAFKPGAIILPGGVPYGQNCVVTSVTTEVPTPLPMNPFADSPQQPNPAFPRGGGCVLADASVLSAYTVYPNMMTWGFTPSSVNGLGYVARNRGFVNPVNAIGVGAHRHFMCIDGGQMVVSGSSSQFGDYSFWSEGSTQRIEPLKVNPNVIPESPLGDALSTINSFRTDLINDVWNYLNEEYTLPSGFETLTRKDSGLFLDAIAYSLQYSFERPMLNFAEGMFKFNGECVYEYPYHEAFKASWDRLASRLIITGAFSPVYQSFILELVSRLKSTTDNYWLEVGQGPAPALEERVIRRLRSLITAINHQWTAPLSGVEYFRVPPSRASRRIKRSIVQRGGGKVRFSGQDDSGNAVFVGGLVIDSRSGQLGGPPFDSAIRGRVTRAVISRSY